MANRIGELLPKPIRMDIASIYDAVDRWMGYLSSRIPWLIKSRDELHAYWKHPWDEGNAPEDYANPKGEVRSQFLVSLIKRYATPQSTILEIGCNVGRNLHYLFTDGFVHLTGIELNEEALQLGRQIYPEMQGQITLTNASVEDSLSKLPDNGFDVVFTMAVLEHIHPTSVYLFNDIARITKHYLITIEDEAAMHWRAFPRNYQRVFTRLHMNQVWEQRAPADLSKGFVARVFEPVPTVRG